MTATDDPGTPTTFSRPPTPAQTSGPLDAGDLLMAAEHEQVVHCHDPKTGLRAIIGVHNTALGSPIGGARFYPYSSYAAALDDVLKLSRGMSYKNALAGIPHGGAKAVIIGDPTKDKTPELLRAFGRFVQTLDGRYITAADVGTNTADIDIIGETTRWVLGRSPERGGSGDPSPLTAFGVFQGMRAAAQQEWGTPSVAGKRVGIAGIGKVGRHLAELVLEDGASVVVTDVNTYAIEALRSDHPSVEVAGSAAELAAMDLDVFAPCALGGALDFQTVEALRASIVCGAANNQLATHGPGGTAERLAERGITYCPDFLVNAGGVINVSDELDGFDLERARTKVAAIFEHTTEVLEAATAHGITPADAADRIAESRIAAGSPTILVPHPGSANDR